MNIETIARLIRDGLTWLFDKAIPRAIEAAKTWILNTLDDLIWRTANMVHSWVAREQATGVAESRIGDGVTDWLLDVLASAHSEIAKRRGDLSAEEALDLFAQQFAGAPA